MTTTDNQPIPLATDKVRRVLDKAAQLAAQPEDNDQRTYAEVWANSINETYTDDPYAVDEMANDWLIDHEIGNVPITPGVYPPKTHEENRKFLLLTLAKAAVCLRSGVPATFTHPELDLVRHLMPAHEVHQSGSKRWVLQVMCETDEERQMVLDYYHQHMTEREREILNKIEEQEK